MLYIDFDDWEPDMYLTYLKYERAYRRLRLIHFCICVAVTLYVLWVV